MGKNLYFMVDNLYFMIGNLYFMVGNLYFMVENLFLVVFIFLLIFWYDKVWFYIFIDWKKKLIIYIKFVCIIGIKKDKCLCVVMFEFFVFDIVD